MKKIIITLSLAAFTVFNLQSQTWVQKGSDIYGENAGDNSGSAVELSTVGNTIIIGSPNNDDAGTDAGQVRVYEWNGSAWLQKGVDLNGLFPGDQFGASVAINNSGDVIVIGAPNFDGTGNDVGMVRVYEWNGSAWVQMGADLVGGTAGIQDRFGTSLDLTDILRLAIGAPGGGPTQRGEVKIYEWNGSAWMQMGSALGGDALYDQFGMSVAMTTWDDYLVVGAPQNDGGGSNAGAVKVFLWNGTNWVQEGSTLYGTSSSDKFGYNVTISPYSNPVFMVNAPAIGSASYVKVFEWNMSTSDWMQRGNTLPGCGYYASSATTMSLGGGMFGRISISTASDNSVAGVTRFYLYNSFTNVFNPYPTFPDILGENPSDQSGYAISAINSGAQGFAVGAPGNSGNGTSSGQVKIYDYCSAQYSYISPSIASCNYISPSGNYTYTSSGVYNDTIPNIRGCDSIININLTLLPVSDTISPNACISYTVPSGNQTYYTSGIYTDTLVAVGGCDSILTIDLNVQQIDVSITNNGSIILVNTLSSMYQWVECPSYTPIPGADMYSFIPSTVGSYAVIITNASLCSDTSVCTFVNVGIDDHNNFALQIYPNPASEYFTIEGLSTSTNVHIIDAMGSVITSVTNYSPSNKIDISSLTPGIYFIQLEGWEKKIKLIVYNN